MKNTSYDIEKQVEGFHWWFSARRKLLKSILSTLPLPLASLALDIGCGTGANLKMLGSTGLNAIGIDRSIYALSLTQKKIDFPLINGDVNELPIRPESVGLILAADVLEHLENDLNGIHEFYQALKKGGLLILTVPAFSFLRGIQDIVTGHKRRYSKKDILNKLRAEGFDILRSSYFNFFLFFPILFTRRIISLFALKIDSENKINFPLMNFFLKAIFSLELYLLEYVSFPFGVSIFCIARK
jgi:SAM-dependent methyltransferase